MSVQLIISPQSTETTTTTTTSSGGGTEFIVDGNNFTFLNTATTAEGVTDWSVFGNGGHALTVNPPTSPNTWYRYRNVSNAHSPSYQPYPTQSGGNVTFTTLGTSAASYPNYENNWGAIYQTMTGLTVGQVYLVRIKNNCVITEQSRAVVEIVNVYDLEPPVTSGYDFTECTATIGPPCVLNGNDILYEFIATQTEHIFYLSMAAELNTVTTATITDISVTDVPTTTTTSTSGFSADDLHGQQILDLYEDETIPLTLSVDDFKDVATKTQSYSKAFHLPATKKNNRIFGNLFEITKATGLYTFNPYKKTSVMLKENGFIVFEGFLKLIDIVDKKGEISYNVNLYSDSVALMDAMKDLTFADLNLSELDHTYNITSIEASQTGALPLLNALQADSFAGAAGDTTTSVLKYPFLNWAGSIKRNATSGQVSDGATANRPSLKRLEDGFRPFINVKYLVDNIFKDAGFTYSSAFFDSSYFSNLYMDFNWGEDPNGSAPLRNDRTRRKSTAGATTAIGQTFTNIPVDQANNVANNGTGTGGSVALWNNTAYSFFSDVNNLAVTGSYKIQVKNTASVNEWSAELRVCKFDSDNNVLETFEQEKFIEIPAGGVRSISGTYETVMNNGDYIQMEAKDFNSSAKIYVDDDINGYSYLSIIYNNNAVQVPTLLDTARGEMVQWDFLKGLFSMFNLITLQDKQNPSNILIEPYNDVFSDDVTTLDWTHKVDVSDIKLKALDLKKRVVFKYEEDEDDYPFGVYKLATGGYLYGSLTLDSSQLDLLSGEDEVIASPFAATIMKDLFDDTPELTAPSIYGTNENHTEFGSIKNLPRILIDTGVYTASDTFYVPAQNGVADDNKSTYSMFSHTSAVPASSTDDDLNFGACQLINPSMGVSPVNNLYSTYYARYFQELYSPDVRSMTLKVLLTPNDIANFNFYDKVFIKNREYRVDKINYKPNDLSTVDFILIT